MANWRDEMEHLGLDLRDGGRSLLDLRFADDISIFGTDYHVIGVLLKKKLVENLAAVGIDLFFFFPRSFFPRESLTRTVLLVSLQAAGAP